MWIVTERGFFTFVTDRKDPNYLWLRARMREHIEDNFPGVTAEMKPGADYLFRAKVKRIDVAQRIAELVLESRITSHFKDVFIKTAAKPKTGSLSNAMYAFWRGAAEWQPYRPYSRIPRDQERKIQFKGGSTGQGSTFPAYSSYGDRRAADFDWSTYDWKRQGTPVGATARDPSLVTDFDSLTDDAFDQEWDRMTPEEQQAFLDAEEADLRAIEMGEDEGAQVAHEEQWYPSPGTVTDWAKIESDRREADRQRQQTIRGRKGRKRGRKNRHNQQGA